MNRKLNLQKRRCDFHNWPIRRQLMISFLCTTLVLQIIILGVIIINLTVMKNQTNDQVQDLNYQKQTIQLKAIAFQIGLAYLNIIKLSYIQLIRLIYFIFNNLQGHSMQAHYYHLTTILIGFETMFNVFQIDQDLYSTNQELNLTMCSQLTSIDYSQVCYFIPGSSGADIQNLNEPTYVFTIDQTIIQNIIALTQGYNDLLPSFMNTYLRTQVNRLVLLIQQKDEDIQICMVYPAQPVNLTIQFDNYNQYDQQIGGVIKLDGPQLDEYYNTTFGQQQQTLVYLSQKNILNIDLPNNTEIQYEMCNNDLIYLQFINSKQLQYLSISYYRVFRYELLIDLNYLPTAEIVLTDINKNIIYAPQYWGTKQNQQISQLYDYTNYSGIIIIIIIIIGISLSSTFSYNLSISEVDRMFSRNDTLYPFILVQVPLTGTFEAPYIYFYINESMTVANTQVESNTGQMVYLYVMKSELFANYELITTITNNELQVIVLLTLISCVTTVAIVFIFTYQVAVNISRPLNRLIITASKLSASTTQKNVTKKILAELSEINAQNQIYDLIQAFTNLVNTIEYRSTTQKSTANKQALQYPLNQFDQAFIEKTKAVSDINWENVINEIEEFEE